MKRVILAGLLVAAGAAGGSALAADDAGAWYLSPMVQWWHLDNDRDATSHLGYQLGIGKYLSSEWAAEVAIGGGKFNTPSGADLSLLHYSLDFIRTYLPDSTVHPYVIFGGGGFQDHQSGAPSTGTFGAEAGLGLLTDLGDQTGSARWKLRTEVKYQHEFSDRTASSTDLGDVVFGVGVQFLFAIPTPPPPPPVAAAPPPPPPPAAPPPPPPAPLDSDGDGVPDSIDRCPNTPKGDKVDAYGCTIKDEIKLERVHFATDSAALEGDNGQVLDYAVATLKKYPEMVIEVAGHTDNRGSKKHNQLLSEHRAATVLDYLKEHGIANRMTAKGYGEDDPIADNSTPEGRQQNRRVGLRIVGGP